MVECKGGFIVTESARVANVEKVKLLPYFEICDIRLGLRTVKEMRINACNPMCEEYFFKVVACRSL